MGEYAQPLRDAVIRAKSITGESLALRLGELLAQRIASIDLGPIDFLVTTPQHWTRRLFHRTNSSDLIGEAVSRELGLPLKTHWLHRTRPTQKQGMLSTVQRRRNVLNAFAISRSAKVAGASLLIVDDVLTSGSTASEMAKVLLRAGARRIQVAAVARGVGNQPAATR